MRLANLGGRAVLVDGEGQRFVDLERASGGEFAADPMAAFAVWNELRTFAGSADWSGAEALDPTQVGPCVPRPPQVFGIGLNSRDHAQEAGLDTCAQEAWANRAQSVSAIVNAPEELMLFCGMAVGYKDPDQPVNTLVSDREPLENWTTFV